MFSRVLIQIICLVGVTFVLRAQPLTSTTYETMLKVAEESADKSDYANAIEWFETAYKESKDKNLKIAIGDLYMLLRDYNKAERAYAMILKRDNEGIFEDVRIDYAKALKYQGNYRDALTELRVVASTSDDEEIKKEALFEIAGIEAMDTYAQNLEAVISFVPGDINSGSGENAAVTYYDGALYYSSFNAKKEIVLDGDEEFYEAKIYTASKNKEGVFEKPTALNKQINREGYNNAGVSFSGDGRVMYFTRAVLNVNSIEESTLYRSIRKDNGWGAAEEIENLNGDYLILHPIEGELFGNRVLFFVSDMEGGLGGLDIYYSTITGDSYASPINVGPSVNTPDDDITPYYNSGTLYFSSNGRPGLGGHDIWYASWNGSSFDTPVNMGYNYNSAQDDMYLRFDPNGKGGFLVSNRPDKDKKKLKGSTTCCDDIYEIQLREIVIDLLATVVDENGPLKEATVEVIDLSVADESEGIFSKTNVIGNDFNFVLEPDHKYRVVVTKDGYYPDTTVTFNTVGILDSYTVKKEVTLRPMPKTDTNDGSGEETETVAINQPIRLNNIYYDFDKWDILPDAEDDLGYLKTLLDKYSDMVIELSSHTDAQGDAAYNQKLSQRRAESAKNWLVSNGVAPSRIKAVGYGESNILNHCVNKVKCSDNEHRFNRRTEFKIIAGPQTIEIKRETTTRKTSSSGGSQSWNERYPIISFVQNDLDLGELRKGEQKAVEFHFTNTGDTDLVIEIVTACKCTSLEWPREAIPAGKMGVIKVSFDTSEQDLGEVEKTVDIIANTQLIVTEAKFKAVILPALKKTNE